MLLQHIEEGGEIFLSFAKKKLRDLHAQMIQSGVWTRNMVIEASEGSRIFIDSLYLGAGLFRDKIRITIGGSFAVAAFTSGAGAYALTTRAGTVVGPRRFRFYFLDGFLSTFELAYRDDGVRGSEYSSGWVGTGAETYTPLLGGKVIALAVPLSLSFFGRDDGTFESAYSYYNTSPFTDPLDAWTTRVLYDPAAAEGARWSETTNESFLPAAKTAATGLSSPAAATWTGTGAHMTYAMPSPFPASLGGTKTLRTPVNIHTFGLILPRSVLDPEPAQVFRRGYVTAATAGGVYTDYETDNVTVKGYGCWVEIEGTEETWVSRFVPATVGQSQVLTDTYNWAVHAHLYYSVASGASSFTVGPVLDAGESYNEVPVDIASPYSLYTNAAHASTVADESGNWALVRAHTTWDAASFSAAAGPTYRDSAGVTQQAGLYTAGAGSYATVELVVNGSVVWSDDGPVSGTAAQATATVGSTISNTYSMRFGKAGFSYTFNSATPETHGAFWNGTTMLTEVQPSGAGAFFWAVAHDDSSYIVGWNERELRFYEGGALALTIPLSGDEAYAGMSHASAREFRTLYAPGGAASAGVGRTYTITRNADTGVYSYTYVEDTVADVWDYEGSSLPAVYANYHSPHTYMDRGAARAVVL